MGEWLNRFRNWRNRKEREEFKYKWQQRTYPFMIALHFLEARISRGSNDVGLDGKPDGFGTIYDPFPQNIQGHPVIIEGDYQVFMNMALLMHQDFTEESNKYSGSIFRDAAHANYNLSDPRYTHYYALTAAGAIRRFRLDFSFEPLLDQNEALLMNFTHLTAEGFNQWQQENGVR